MDQLHRQLTRRAHLFDDAAAYEAGVRDALAAVAAVAAGEASGDGTGRHVEGPTVGEEQARVAAAMRAHPAAGRSPLRAVGDPVG